ncbi:class I SAM-dependent methyltransferase [Amycolatopsis sp. H20-H5]|uniref:class I SAM-dependent methyltransferase n=1 Tax=Amycolatopsis sp. H20-H5 TaxID=3046309 RepID=UPI002DB62E15|nr:methyltransferase domain-containing protein [Amycolatopsis sp. H20-H5]MEC3981929.1 methyltransferase domain-containing protein [Amycolatopsis sp. H20-H5]
MGTPEFDIDGMFDADYLHFMAKRLGAVRSNNEVDLIQRLVAPEPGAAILDLCCGHGRLTNRLAARGHRVTGLDVTALFLDRARADAAALGVAPEYVLGDMKDLPWTGRFDLVVNWFTAFGYFDDDGNKRVLAEVARALRPGGRFVLDLNNYTAVLNTYQHTTATERDGDLLIDRGRLDPLTGRQIVERTLIRGDTVRRARWFVRMFTFPELRDWLLDAGFGKVDGYGEDCEPLAFAHRRMIVVAQR